jgi:hypothetical protein
LAGLFFKIFNRLLGRWRGALAAGIGIALYTLLVGAGPSVVRAAIMGGWSLFARQGLPSPETLEAVKGYTLLRNDRNGWIELITISEQLWLEVERL